MGWGIYKILQLQKVISFEKEISIHILADFVMNKDFLFETSSRKGKGYVAESQTALLVWSCLNHLQKNIAQLITRLFLMIHSVSFTSAAFEAFAKAYLCFLVSASDKKMLR